MRASRVMSVAAGLGALGAAGCITPANDDPAIAGQVRLEALTPVSASSVLSPTDTPHTLAERAEWETTLVLVPAGVTANEPVYRTRIGWAKDNRRQRGEYPTAESCLDLMGGPDSVAQQGEALWAPFVAAGDVILLLPRMILYHPFHEKRSPRGGYDRYWLYHADLDSAKDAAETMDKLEAEEPELPPAERPEGTGGR